MKHQALSDRTIATVKPDCGKTQLTDGDGLYLKLFFDRPAHSWRFDYKRPNGKRTTFVIGDYFHSVQKDAPRGITLALARAKAQEFRDMLARGIDPMGVRDEAKAEQQATERALAVNTERAAKKLAPAGTLLGVAEDYHADKLSTSDWAELHAEQWISMVKRCLPKHIAHMPIADVKPAHLLADVVRPLEREGKIATSRTVRKYLTQVFDYAEVMELRQGNPARAIRSQAAQNVSHKLGNNPAVITPEDLTMVLKAISAWPTVVTRAALQVQVALFQRPSDTCEMKWADLDLDDTFDNALWTIKADPRTKLAKSLKGADHVIPLPKQVVELLKSLKPLTGHTPFVFYSPQDTGKSITNDTLTNALRNMGLGDKQTAHGFRATARTMIRKHLRIDAEVIEAQLAHASSEEMGSAYDRISMVLGDERAVMLQRWADYLDQLVTGPQQLVEQPAPVVEQLTLQAA